MTFNVGGSWNLQQSNGPLVTVNIQQNGEELSGTGTFGGNSGTARGRTRGTSLVYTIDWPGSSKGEYNGTFGTDGRLTGHTFDVNDPTVQAEWVSIGRFSQI